MRDRGIRVADVAYTDASVDQTHIRDELTDAKGRIATDLPQSELSYPPLILIVLLCQAAKERSQSSPRGGSSIRC